MARSPVAARALPSISLPSAPRPSPRPSPAPRRPPLRLVPPPETRAQKAARRRARATIMVLVALTFGVMLGILGLRVLLAQGQVRIDELEAQVARAQTDNQHLRLEVATLESPQRIVEEARNRLGMVPPGSVTYLAPVATPDAAPTTP